MLLRLIPLLLALTATLTSQDVRDNSTPVANITLVGASVSSINNTIAQGYRLTNLTYRGSGGLLGTSFDAVFVHNSGSYGSGWWWYYGLTSSQLATNLSNNQARLIDLEPYTDSNGNQRFACVMVPNTGSNAKAWWYYINTSISSLSSAAATNNARIVDLDHYTLNGTTYHSAVMIRNTGADFRLWWWYANATVAQISSYQSTNNARIYDLEPASSGRFDCVMVRDNNFPQWHWWVGLSASEIAYKLTQYGERAIDLCTYTSGGVRKWAMVTINNSNELTTDVGNQMRAATDGQVGIWLKRINGATLANLNGDTVFEPASTMKTLHHVHAMRRIALGLSNTTPLTVFSQYSAPGSSCPIDVGAFSEGLQTVLFQMMDASDNARTQAVTAYFGENNINNTATALGMNSTELRHRLGCGLEAIATPNQITLRDLDTLHTQVAGGYLGNQRNTFYDLMRNDLSQLDSVITAEGISLGMSSATLATFRGMTEIAHKGGNYGLSSGGPLWYERAEFGWLSVPFISNGSVVPREYGFGGFVNNASNDSQAADALYNKGLTELFRPTIRAALQSWSGSLATAVPVGVGCGSPAFTQFSANLPRIGVNATYYSTTCLPNMPVMFGVGFSATSAGPLPLPFALAPIGGEPGCFAFNDIVISDASLAGSTGYAQFQVALPPSPANVGFQYWSQMYSFGPGSFRSSNSIRSTVGY